MGSACFLCASLAALAPLSHLCGHWSAFNAAFISSLPVLESIKFAPLGGKILFKNLRYHSTNQSVSIVQGYVTFRYWLRHVLQNDFDTSASGKHKSPKSRILVYLNGLEYFIYNRTPAYDYLDELMKPKNAGDAVPEFPGAIFFCSRLCLS